LKRACTAEDIAGTIVFLCAGTSMITGHTIIFDGGLTL
jgi:3-oxoacyl-[acyl-carrier protein] reductase